VTFWKCELWFVGAGFRGYGGDLEAVERMSQWRGDGGKGVFFSSSSSLSAAVQLEICYRPKNMA